MLRRLALRDFVIVEALEVEFETGFSVLTGETGAGKSILVDALQLALGARADATVVREGSQRADISAEFDSPAALAEWLEAGGFEPVGMAPWIRLQLLQPRLAGRLVHVVPAVVDLPDPVVGDRDMIRVVPRPDSRQT